MVGMFVFRKEKTYSFFHFPPLWHYENQWLHQMIHFPERIHETGGIFASIYHKNQPFM